MPVIYSNSTGTKGFMPCSKPYQRQILRFIELSQYDFAADLFFQAHRLVWQWRNADQMYHHISDPTITMSRRTYQRIAALKPENITPQLLAQQCPVTVRGSAFFGPQLKVHHLAQRRMQALQTQSYGTAAEHGFPVPSAKGLGTYSPSPFEQVRENRVWRPVNPEHAPGKSSGACVENKCEPGLECSQGVCVVPLEQRQCPPFQYPITLTDDQGPFTVENLSADRTRQVTRFSNFHTQAYNTCIPNTATTHTRWIPENRLRRYIGLGYAVMEIPIQEWYAEVREFGYPIEKDPNTGSSYFVYTDEDGLDIRMYPLNAAYTPYLDQKEDMPEEPYDQADYDFIAPIDLDFLTAQGAQRERSTAQGTKRKRSTTQTEPGTLQRKKSNAGTKRKTSHTEQREQGTKRRKGEGSATVHDVLADLIG